MSYFLLITPLMRLSIQWEFSHSNVLFQGLREQERKQKRFLAEAFMPAGRFYKTLRASGRRSASVRVELSHSRRGTSQVGFVPTPAHGSGVLCVASAPATCAGGST